MDMYEGQNEPMQIKWAIEGSGNPFDFESEAAKAESEVNDLKRKYKLKTSELPVEASKSVPEMAFLNKREQKQREKDAHQKKVREIRTQERAEEKDKFEGKLAS